MYIPSMGLSGNGQKIAIEKVEEHIGDGDILDSLQTVGCAGFAKGRRCLSIACTIFL
jgi:hypothetical protein